MCILSQLSKICAAWCLQRIFQQLSRDKYVRKNIKWIVKVTKILHFVSTLEILFSYIHLIHMWSFRRISLTFNSSTMTSSEWGNKSCLNNNNTPQKNVYTHMKFLPFLSLTHSLTSTSVMAVTIWNEKKYCVMATDWGISFLSKKYLNQIFAA